MSENRALAHAEPAAPIQWTEEKIRVLKQQIAPEATDDELELFMLVCDRKRLDPFSRQIYAIHRNQRNRDGSWSKKMTIQTSIDGFRLIAERTGKYLGQDGPYWCGEDGKWHDVWFGSEPPKAAKVGVYKVGASVPTYAVAHWDEYVQTDRKSGNPIGLWATMPRNQIAKCAEALALRKVFPEELSGLYTSDEMAQADNEPMEPIDFEEQRRRHHARTLPEIAEPAPAEVFEPEEEEIEAEWQEVEPLTEGQTKKLAKLMEQVPEDERKNVLATYGAKSIGTLSKESATKLIGELSKIQADQQKIAEEQASDEVLMGYIQDLRKLGEKPNSHAMKTLRGQDARRFIVVQIRDTLLAKVQAAETFDALTGLEADWSGHRAWTDKVQAAFDEKSAALAEAGVTE